MSPQRRVKHRALSQTNTHILSHVLFGHGRKCLNALCNVMNFTKLIVFSTQSYFQNRTSAVKFSVGKTIIHLNTSHNCIYQSVCYLKLAQCSWSWKQTKVCLKNEQRVLVEISDIKAGDLFRIFITRKPFAVEIEMKDHRDWIVNSFSKGTVRIFLTQ